MSAFKNRLPYAAPRSNKSQPLKTPPEITALAKTLRETRLPSSGVRIGEIFLKPKQVTIAPLNFNRARFELLRGWHDYQVEIGGRTVDLSLQLYLNVNHHYRLFGFCRCGSAEGMMFSLNFTTAKDINGIIGLSQKIQFREGRDGDPERARQIRGAKKRIMAEILVRSGFDVTDNDEVNLGTYSATQKAFLDTTPEAFLSQFLAVALLKGHLQGNKGYQFACLPRYDDSFAWKWDSTAEVMGALGPNKRGRRGARAIPLGLRFRVLERDGGKCVLCGQGPAMGATLHIDHVTPFSLGGLTTLSNLQTLCDSCNLGKGNRSKRSFVQE
ncbi:MAG: HNH endonuclease [Verrucomicrobiales bacterium]|nr:HNH endonuclease [Verrucomicrobiales bacterium]